MPRGHLSPLLLSYLLNTLSLCVQLLVVAMSLETPRQAVREVIANVEEDTEDTVQEQTRGVVSRLIAPALKTIEEALQDGRCVCEVPTNVKL